MTGALSLTPAYLSLVWMKSWVNIHTNRGSLTKLPVQRRETRACQGWLQAGAGWSCWGARGSSSFPPIRQRVKNIMGEKEKTRPFRSNQDGICRSWSCGDADHQRFRDLQGASCAFRTWKNTMLKGLALYVFVKSVIWASSGVGAFGIEGGGCIHHSPFERPCYMARLAPGYSISTIA